MSPRKTDPPEVLNSIDRKVEIVIEEAKNFQAFHRNMYAGINDFIESMEKMRSDLKEEYEKEKKEKREIIFKAMEEKGKSIQDLADIAEVSSKIIEDMLDGKKDLSISKIIKIGLALGIYPKDIE